MIDEALSGVQATEMEEEMFKDVSLQTDIECKETADKEIDNTVRMQSKGTQTKKQTKEAFTNTEVDLKVKHTKEKTKDASTSTGITLEQYLKLENVLEYESSDEGELSQQRR